METHNKTGKKITQKSLSFWCVKVLILPVQFYQYIVSPWLGQNCRFYPSCSNYSIESLKQHGPLKGLYLATIRLGKCHPWHQGGYDPVPLNSNTQQKMVKK